MQGICHRLDNAFVQLDFHDAVFPMPPPLPALTPSNIPHFATGTLSQSGSHKSNQLRIKADGFHVISRGHEVKRMILPHLNFPGIPINTLIPVLIATSSNKIEFAASGVQGPDGPIAMGLFGMMSPSMACNDPHIRPTGMVFTGGTVLIGFTIGDVIAGVAMCALDALVDHFLGMAGEALGAGIGGEIAQRMAVPIASWALGALAGTLITGGHPIGFLGGLALGQVTGPIVEPLVRPLADVLSNSWGWTQMGERVGSEVAKEGLNHVWTEGSGRALSAATDGEINSTDGLFSPIARSADNGVDSLFGGSERLASE